MKRKKPRKGLPHYLWTSFADEDQPDGKRFLGVVILRARSVEEALRIAWRCGINPGGQALTLEMPDDFELPAKFQFRLLSRADIIELEGEAHQISELSDEGKQRLTEMLS